ncbi:hypothetical protein [Sphingomonas sp. GB1N7]|uniref:hypothetical protein n=1 Tax=Parasphingomonas caseinilytica TaxID=3096158 RepID=UPI002FCC20B4
MSEGHGDHCADGAIACEPAVEPVFGSSDAGEYSTATRPDFLVVNGIEINRAKILEKSHERIVGN